MLPRASPRPRQTAQLAAALYWLLIGLSLAACTRASPIEEAALLSQKGQDREAIAMLEAYIGRDRESPGGPDKTPERRLLVRLYGSTGDLGRAEQAAGDLAAHLPTGSPLPWIELGHALELAHRYDEALSMYDRAADTAPRDAVGPRTGGMRAARWGEVELAAPRLEEALRRNSRDASAWHALGLVRLHLGDFDGARVAYESGLVADPRALENRLGLATLALRRGDGAMALAEYDKLLAIKPEYREGHLGRAWALALAGRYTEANGALDEASRLGADAAAVLRQRRAIEARARGAGSAR
jgi:tetratricopeptide (TPR) repeat protein